MKVFFELIKRYETISYEEIQNTWHKKGLNCAKELTGFGASDSCTLCQNYFITFDGIFRNRCIACPWVKLTGYRCNQKFNLPTYDEIGIAETVDALFTAYRYRAEYMKQVLKQNNIDYESKNEI